MSLSVNIMTDGPADPTYVLELADALPEIIRCLNHLTRHHESLVYPSDADHLVQNIGRAVSMLPQLLEQVSGWIQVQQATGRITIADGSSYTTPALAADVARLQLEQAQAHARMLQHALDAAAAVTADMSGVEDGSDE